MGKLEFFLGVFLWCCCWVEVILRLSCRDCCEMVEPLEDPDDPLVRGGEIESLLKERPFCWCCCEFAKRQTDTLDILKR